MAQTTLDQAQIAFNTVAQAAALAPLNRAQHDSVSASVDIIKELLQGIYTPVASVELPPTPEADAKLPDNALPLPVV